MQRTVGWGAVALVAGGFMVSIVQDAAGVPVPHKHDARFLILGLPSLMIIAGALALRMFAAYYHIVTFDIISIIPLLGGIFVVAGGRFRGRRKDWFGQLVGLDQACRQLDSANRARSLIFLPARAGHIAAGDALNRQRLRLANHHGSAV